MQSRPALQAAAAAEGWSALPASSKAGEVRVQLMSADHWKRAEMLVALLRPVADAVHNLEGEKPHMADCHVTLLALRKHVVDWSANYCDIDLALGAVCPVTSRALATLDRRLDAQPGGMIAPMYNPAYSASYALELYYADIELGLDGPFCSAPALSAKHMKSSRASAACGWRNCSVAVREPIHAEVPKDMQSLVARAASKRWKVQALAKPGSKRDHAVVPSSKERLLRGPSSRVTC